jgi:hypothetical protein
MKTKGPQSSQVTEAVAATGASGVVARNVRQALLMFVHVSVICVVCGKSLQTESYQ